MLKPKRIFWIFAASHLVLWTLIPHLVSPNAPLDVIEGYAWGREWLIGTYKHPPMQAWWLEIFAFLLNRAPWSHFLASQVAVVIAFWAVWQTGRRLTDEKSALLGALLLEGVIYYNFTSPEFNPNVLQLPFWALMAWSFHRAVKEDRMCDWLLLGVWTAGGLYSKYSTLLMAAVLALLMLHPEARRRLRGAGPYLAAATALALFAPHLKWLVANDFLPFAYAKSRAMAQGASSGGMPQTLKFLGAQFLALSALFLMFLVLTGGRIKRRVGAPSFDRAFLNGITFGPLLLVMLIAVAGGLDLRDMWGSCLWDFIGLWFLLTFETDPKAIRRFATTFVVVFFVGLAAHAGNHFFGPPYLHVGKRVHFPGKALAENIVHAWQERFNAPVNYVAGDTWLAGNVAYYAPDRPHVFINGSEALSPWIAPEAIRHDGAVLVWCAETCRDESAARVLPPHLAARFPAAEIQEPLRLAWQTPFKAPGVFVGWAIVPPAL